MVDEPAKDPKSRWWHDASIVLMVGIIFFGLIVAHGALLIMTSDPDGLAWIDDKEFFYGFVGAVLGAARIKNPIGPQSGEPPE